MKFLADMAISQTTVARLREQGHDALHVRDEERIVLTLDLDFGYLMAISGATLPSVIILRLGNETAEVITQRLDDTLACCEEALRAGAIVMVDDHTIRIRQLPITRD